MDSAIKTDCAECAYKHLMAAYALGTIGTTYMVGGRDNLMSCPATFAEYHMGDVMLARAHIALTEALHGYPSHIELAIGYMAALEPVIDLPSHYLDAADRWAKLREKRDHKDEVATLRQARKALAQGGVAAVEKTRKTLTHKLSVPTATAFARAHLAEALREWPEGVPRMDLANWDAVLRAADRIRKDYELISYSAEDL